MSQVELLEVIGQGAFGKVWKGRIDCNINKTDQFQLFTSSKIQNSSAAMDTTVAR